MDIMRPSLPNLRCSVSEPQAETRSIAKKKGPATEGPKEKQKKVVQSPLNT